MSIICCLQLMKRSVITSDFEKQEVAPPMKPSFRALKKAKKVCYMTVTQLAVTCAHHVFL